MIDKNQQKPSIILTARVKKINSHEQWYLCNIQAKNGLLAQGYGTTHSLAVDDAMRDLKKCHALQAK